METNAETPPVAVISQEEIAHNEQMQAHADSKVEGGLPSDAPEVKADMFNGMSDEWKEANLKEGRLFGKFDDMESFANSYKKLNDEKAQNGSVAKSEAENLSKEENRRQVEDSQLSEIANNGFNINEDNFKAFEDAGMSRAEAELSVLKMEKAANTAYAMVGGKEAYESLMTWAGDNLSETQIKAFASETVGDNFSIKTSGEFAIRGLQSMMKEAGATTQAQSSGRISGHTAPNKSNVGFGTKAEFNKAMQYLRSNPMDTNAQREYEHKMGHTNLNNLR